MQEPSPEVGLQPATEKVAPPICENMARRVSIQALVGSPEASRTVIGFQSSPSAPHETLIEKAPLMSDATPASVAPSVLVASQWGLSNRPHPVKQLQGAVSKGRRNKKHVCEFPGCGREFSRKSNLEAHSRKHMTGAQATPYACQHCARRFKWRSSLKSHEAGCMHQSLPNAIQRQQQLEQRRHEMHRRYVEEQERLKMERRKSQQAAVRWPRAALHSQRPTGECGANSSGVVTRTQSAAVSASPVSDVKGSDFGTRTPLQGSARHETSSRDRGCVAIGTQLPVGSLAIGNEQATHSAPGFQAASHSDQAGMLSSLCLPPLGLIGNPR